MKSGYVVITGKPNVGKSTLLNALLNCRIAAVSPKPQTTRQRIVGIANGPDYQMLFLDTPGLLTPRYPLQKVMAKEIDLAMADADVILLVVEPGQSEAEKSKIQSANRRQIQNPKLEAQTKSRAQSPRSKQGSQTQSPKLEGSAKRTVVAVNKIDSVSKLDLLPIVADYARQGYETIVPISALHRDGIAELLEALKSLMPEGAPYYPTDQLTTQPEKFFAGELIREAIFNLYGEEIPYSTLVEIVEFREQSGRKDVIRAVIYVERESQKAIVIGRGGQALKRLGIRARERIEGFLERPVFLELRVKTKDDWRQDEQFVREQLRQQ